jgi:hypothetical protein
LKDFRNHVAQGYFERQGVLFYDYLRFPPFSMNYRYFFDAGHPMPPVMAAVLLSMDSDPRFRALLPRLDTEPLWRGLEADSKKARHLDWPP